MAAEKILLVDDEEGIRKVLGISLADIGYDVLTAENGEKALRIFKEFQPPVVLTDIKMPGMDGIELLHKIKTENPETEVIMITGHGDMNLAITSLKYEATDFISKPINQDVLEIALNRAHEKISMRRQIKEYTENLEQLVREKSAKIVEIERQAAVGQTVAGLAHGIKNLITALEGGMYMLSSGLSQSSTDRIQKGLEMLTRNIERISTFVKAFLSFSRGREIKVKLSNPAEIAKEVVELYSVKARKLGIELNNECSGNIKPAPIDYESMHECLTNLVGNAIDACHLSEKGRRTHVTVRTFEENETVIYEVVDDGCGMDYEVKKKVFTTFFTTKGLGGSGIGLLMTKKIIQEHGGAIDLKTEPGEGSTFRITLHRKRLPKTIDNKAKDIGR
ncbi:MAG: response regulator [Desulfobacterales bacterium]|nr:response regulator [Desulfobacterales bacterium]